MTTPPGSTPPGPNNPFAPPTGFKPQKNTPQMTQKELNRVNKLTPERPLAEITAKVVKPPKLGPPAKQANSLFLYYQQNGLLNPKEDQSGDQE